MLNARAWTTTLATLVTLAALGSAAAQDYGYGYRPYSGPGGPTYDPYDGGSRGARGFPDYFYDGYDRAGATPQSLYVEPYSISATTPISPRGPRWQTRPARRRARS